MKKILKTLITLFAISVFMGIFNVVYADSIKIEGETYFEAENADYIGHPMYVEPDTTASGGKFVLTSAGTSSTTPVRGTVNMRYNIKTTEDDGYFLWAKVRIYDTAANTFSADFDDGVFKMAYACEDATENPGEWVWCFIDKFYLFEGEHQLNIRYRVKNVQFDEFLITNDFSFTPEGASPSIVPPDEIYQRDENGNVKNLYYNLPSYLPPDEHPRLLFRKKDIERIKANLTHPQNIAEYNALQNDATYQTDGKQSQLKYGGASNINQNIGLAIEANAFLYQITGDEAYGHKAIKMAKNFIESLMIDRKNASSTGRTGMNAVWTTALCYDWCYDLLTEEDKEHLAYYMLLQSSYSEPGYPSIYYGVDYGKDTISHSEVNGHILEFQLICGQFAASVAMYDEYPDVYNVAAGRILQYIVPAVNIFNRSATFTEGSAYGIYRYYFEVVNNYMFKAMGHENVYDDEGLSVLGNIYCRQPDGENLQWGDNGNYASTGYITMNHGVYFYLGNMLENPWYKAEYLRSKKTEQKSEANISGALSPAIFLIVNNVDVPADRSFRSYPLTMFTGPESGMMFARTSWDEGYNANTVACLLNLKTRYLFGHEHEDAGHFSIYYKGLLTLDSGIYEGTAFTDSKGNSVTSVGYGSKHHIAYTRQTIAHNSLLIKDPNEKPDDIELKHFTEVDGGQKMVVNRWAAKVPSDLWNEKTTIGEILSYNWGPDPLEPAYSYMKGDITDAYSEKVENVQRSFMFFNFKDEKYPAALIVFDNVCSSLPTFKKTWLLHSEEEPVIDGNTVTIIRDTLDYDGKLINTTLMPTNGFTIEKIGGPGYEFYVEGTNYEMKPKSNSAEVGNWRIEISPKKAEKQSYFLNVMQIGDNNEDISDLKAELVEDTEIYAAAQINNHVAYFKKDGKTSKKDLTINPGKCDGERFIVVTGLAEGKWSVYDADNKLVTTEYAYDGRDSISFTAKGEKFTLKYKYVSNLVAPDYSVFALQQDVEKNMDVQIDNVYETFDNECFYYDGTVFVPIVELLDKLDVDGYTDDFFSVKINEQKIKYDFVYDKNNVTRFNGVLYAPLSLMESVVGFTANYDENASILIITYGMRDRDLAMIYKYKDPAIVNVAYAYTEGETTAIALKSLDNDVSTYSCTIGEGGNFIAELEEESTISKVGLYWYNYKSRREIFDMYVSKDGVEWKQVFSGMSNTNVNGYEYMPVGDGEKYKFIKIECHGNTSNTYNSLSEFIVYR
ncbi:MAG: heparinase II/III family protein [Clostridia bacterium]|nr:heparinase II/III family protein [Clostridia bacterium]